MDDFGFFGKSVDISRYTVVKSYTDRYQEITTANGHIGIICPVHAQHAEPQRIGTGYAPIPIRVDVTGILVL